MRASLDCSFNGLKLLVFWILQKAVKTRSQNEASKHGILCRCGLKGTTFASDTARFLSGRQRYLGT